VVTFNLTFHHRWIGDNCIRNIGVENVHPDEKTDNF
jgi:hypothetical protein